MIKGEQRQQNVNFEQKLETGFDLVKVVAINPSRKELDELLDITDREKEAEEVEYSGETKDGDKRIRLLFVLDKSNGEKAFHSILLINKERENKDGTKVQIVNSTLDCTWVPLDDGKPDESVIPDWFSHFIDKKTKKKLGDKTWRKALVGEEELAILLRAWMGGLNFRHPETEVVIDTKKLLSGNTKELRALIGNEFDREFIALFGVKTVDKTEEDGSVTQKQYQNVYNKAYLSKDFLIGIKAGGKFGSDYQRNVWKKFVEEAAGEYGFAKSSHYTLGMLQDYTGAEDILASNKTKETTETGSDY